MMKIIFDFDGTLTDFNRFIQENAINFFQKKYHMEIVSPDELEIEDIFDIQNTLERFGYSKQEAETIKKRMLQHFWISHRFIKFSLLSRFRPGVRQCINRLKKQGFTIEIHSSRAKTSEDSFIGMIARWLSTWQCSLNGTFLRQQQFFFYPNDEEKVKGILNRHPLLVFDDKEQIVMQLAQAGMKVLCVSGVHNKNVLPSENVELLNSFEQDDIEKKVEKLLGKINWTCHKREVKSLKFFGKLSKTTFFLRKIFHPMVLHSENLAAKSNVGIIYAPNHRSTLDPLIIESVLPEPIHWAALKRFFEGKDSVFNNSKNPVLCKMTKYVFRRLEYFPVERKCDNPNANNMISLKDMDLFLKNGYKVGIFAEGTTRREKGEDFGHFDDAFLRLAKRNMAWVQPITLLWLEEPKDKCKVIVNFGKAFRMEGMSVDEGMKRFMEIQRAGLEENICHLRERRLRLKGIRNGRIRL